MSPFRLPVHGNLPSTFEGDAALHKTVILAFALLGVMAAGLSLIATGLMG